MHQHFFRFLLSGLLSTLSLLCSAAQPADKPINALIVTGVDWPGHLWKETGPAVREILRADSRFTVEIVEDPSYLGLPGLARFDVVVLMFKNYQPIANEEQAWKNLASFVREGKGLAVIHFSSGAFPDRPEFREFIGRAQQKKHDKRGPFTVKIVRPDHAITRGLADFEADDELFIDLAGARPIEVIATAKSNITGQDHPMAFVLTNDQGRVFHTTLGHDVKALQVPGTGELIRRGSAWAAGQPPTVPKNP